MRKTIVIAAVLAGAAILVIVASGGAGGRAVAPDPEGQSATPKPPVPLYDSDPAHIWNRVDRHLRVRTHGRVAHGADDLDPLLWRETRHLLTGPSHTTALALLDEFLHVNAERLVTDPVRRALFQRDLWAVFDWAVSPARHHEEERGALAARLARVIRRVALTPDEIPRVALTRPVDSPHLIDPYAAAVEAGRYPPTHDPGNRERSFLPPRLFDPSGPWIPIHGSAPLPQHSSELSRSYFGVFLSVPGGRAATLEYLKKLWEAPEPFVVDPHGSFGGERRTMINPALHAMPAGSQVALVRKMLLIDTTGDIRYSNIVESIQIRVIRSAEPLEPRLRVLGRHDAQDVYELVLNRSGLLTSLADGLRALGPEDEGFLTFSSHGIDPFERPDPPRAGRVLDLCVACHQEQGLASFRSAGRLFKPYVFMAGGGAALDGNAAFWKSQRADWGQLQAYWQLQPR